MIVLTLDTIIDFAFSPRLSLDDNSSLIFGYDWFS